MAIKITLILGALLLGCCSTGLMIVRFANPRLKGLGWLGVAFATGSTGAILVYFAYLEPLYISVVLADVLVLTSFVFLNMGAEELVVARPGLPITGIVLLVFQAIADVYVITGPNRGHRHVIFVGLLVAVMTAQTAYMLARKSQRSIRGPAMLTASILGCLMIINIVHSAAAILGFLNDEKVFLQVELVYYTLYIVTALGIGFGFFWMTTSVLTAEVEFLASTDPLTRIFNRRVFLLWCEKELERSRRTNVPFSLLMIDIDHFKRLNDRYGHQTGDAALCAVVERMQNSVRGLDVLGRWGGEEFVALLPAASSEDALGVAQRMRSNIEKILLPGSTSAGEDALLAIKVTASIGVSTYRGPEDTLPGMFQRADAALYSAKAAGRNQVLNR